MSVLRPGTITDTDPDYRMVQDGATTDMLVTHVVGAPPVVGERVMWTVVDGLIVVFSHNQANRTVWSQTFHDNRAVLGAAVGTSRAYNTTGQPLSIVDITANANIAPLGSDLVYDVLRNGVSLWDDPGDRPTIPVDAEVWSAVLPDDVSFDVTDYLTVDIVSVGSSRAGGFFVVQVNASGTSAS